jgi:tellurite resistance protein TerC
MGETVEHISIGVWIGFFALVIVMLAIDLGVSRRRKQGMSLRAAGAWTAVWIATALIFNVGIYLWRGTEPALEFFTAYLIEKALSVDNLFVFVLIFTLFGVPALYQRRVLFWGVIGALVMRGVFIGAGAALLHRFHWLMYVFGAFLIFTGVKLALGGETEIKPERNPLIRLFRRLMPVTEEFDGERFFVRRAGVLMATPLSLVLLVVESTDLVFAVDSIPAVLAVTQDPFLVYTSNIFAILGLRALYFLLAGAMTRFHYLKLALSVILGFVGVKMLVSSIYKIPIALSLGVIAGLLTAAVVASLVRARRSEERAAREVEGYEAQGV